MVWVKKMLQGLCLYLPLLVIAEEPVAIPPPIPSVIPNQANEWVPPQPPGPYLSTALTDTAYRTGVPPYAMQPKVPDPYYYPNRPRHRQAPQWGAYSGYQPPAVIPPPPGFYRGQVFRAQPEQAANTGPANTGPWGNLMAPMPSYAMPYHHTQLQPEQGQEPGQRPELQPGFQPEPQSDTQTTVPMTMPQDTPWLPLDSHLN